MIIGVGLAPQEPLLLGLRGWQPSVRWMSVHVVKVAGTRPRAAQGYAAVKQDIVAVTDRKTCPQRAKPPDRADNVPMAFWIEAASSLPSPRGLILAQTVVPFGMPGTESIPAIRQFGLASRSAGKMPPPSPCRRCDRKIALRCAGRRHNCRQHDQHRGRQEKKADLTTPPLRKIRVEGASGFNSSTNAPLDNRVVRNASLSDLDSTPCTSKLSG